MTADDIALQLPNDDHALAMSCNLSVLQQCQKQVKILESAILKRIRLRPEFQSLLHVSFLRLQAAHSHRVFCVLSYDV